MFNLIPRRSKLDVEPQPYILQNEFHSIAWGWEHNGCFIMPNGNRYHYKQPEDWKFYSVQPYEEHAPLSKVWGYETNGEIQTDDLFHNIRLCKRGSILNKIFGGISLSQSDLEILLKSKVVGEPSYYTDQGTRSKSIYIYDSRSDIYRRVLLKCTGIMELVNTSQVATSLIRKLPNIK
ncbi:hypothetical protein [Pedobacter flavus]|uniref:Uncharacterized protein n=1 Tax=Pedobacter flavus TaxID=3113906 RepID=A0ABU7GZC3_9SPHI|nr:hypothetical protein [Pedobacter sp. VNH31]MEE1884369.1 hypothetical protein [Pedobacter sp. VNH31]